MMEIVTCGLLAGSQRQTYSRDTQNSAASCSGRAPPCALQRRGVETVLMRNPTAMFACRFYKVMLKSATSC